MLPTANLPPGKYDALWTVCDFADVPADAREVMAPDAPMCLLPMGEHDGFLDVVRLGTHGFNRDLLRAAERVHGRLFWTVSRPYAEWTPARPLALGYAGWGRLVAAVAPLRW